MSCGFTRWRHVDGRRLGGGLCQCAVYTAGARASLGTATTGVAAGTWSSLPASDVRQLWTRRRQTGAVERYLRITLRCLGYFFVPISIIIIVSCFRD